MADAEAQSREAGFSAAKIAAGVVFAVSAVLLVAWALRLPLSLIPGPGLPASKANTALGFLLGALGLWAAVRRGARPATTAVDRAWNVIRWSAAVGMTLIGGLTFLEYLTGWDLRLDQALFRDFQDRTGTTPGGRMSLVTTLALLLLGFAQLLLDWRPGGRLNPSQWLSVTALVPAFIVLVGYLSGYEAMRRVVPYASMSVTTVLCTLVLGVGVLLARPGRGLAAQILDESAGGRALRQLLPAVILLPPLFSGVRTLSDQRGWSDPVLSHAVMVSALVAAFVCIIWRCAVSLQRVDQARERGSRQLAREVQRLTLLGQVTRAISERQDLRSIFGVVVSRVRNIRRADFACICMADATGAVLTVDCAGPWNASTAVTLGLAEGTRLDAVAEGLGAALQGRLVREDDASGSSSSLARRLAGVGLRSLVLVPMPADGRILGLLLVARRTPGAFDDNDCEFLGQLGETVALAVHHVQLYESLRNAYDELRRSQQAALQQQSLRALGQMASGIAHDINNAISPAALYAESLLERESSLSERARAYLQIIQRAVDDVARTVGRMREFYRQREPALAHVPLDANALVRQVLDLTRARWHDMPLKRGITLNVAAHLAPDLPPFMGAGGEVRDGLVNLVFNAIDALPDGGEVSLQTALLHDPGPRVAITVRDSGIGMDDETRRRCLEPFYTTKGERGTGLGLAMVYGMTQRHGAELTIDTAPGRGTSMRLVFTAAPAGASPPSEVVRPRPVRPLRILLVDDDPLLVNSLADVLRGEGHEVVTADGGQAGIDAFRQTHEVGHAFEVVITDLGMPYVDGREVVAAIRRTGARVAVVLLTGWGQRLSANEPVPAGVDRMLGKPPRLHDVLAVLAELAPETVV